MESSRHPLAGAPFPGHKIPYLEVLRPGPGSAGQLNGWSLSPAILGVLTHWCDRRTIPCTKHLGECEGCDYHKRRPRWDGFLAVLTTAKNRFALFQVTKHAVDSCAALASFESLRGSRVTLRRKGDSREGRVTLQVELAAYPGILPSEPDVASALERLWGVHPSFVGRAVVRNGSSVERGQT